MFKKYLTQNLKHRKLLYFALVFLEIAMLIIGMIAHGIMLDNISRNSWDAYYANKMTVRFEESIGAAELYEKLVEFSERSPVPLRNVELFPTDADTGKYNCSPVFEFFPTYSDLKARFEEYATNLPTEQEYINKEKVVLLGKSSGYNEYGDYIYIDENHVDINGETYRIAGELPGGSYAIFFLGSEPRNTDCRLVWLEYKKYPTEKEVDEINDLFSEIVISGHELGNYSEPQPKTLLNIRKTASSIVMALFVQIICAFNIMLIFKFIIDMRRKQFAVFRLCGFNKSVCLKYSFAEIMIISGFAAVISCLVVQALKPVLSKTYGVFGVMYDFKYFALLSLGFLAVTAVIFAVYILPSLGKSVSRELREI